MKTKNLATRVVLVAVASLALGTSLAMAQDSSAVMTAPPAAASTPTPQLAYGVPQILQLTQAKVGDDTIIAYIKNSGTSYGLTADQIIYLRQQGVSEAVVNTMLNQPKPAAIVATPATPAPAVAATTAPAPATTTVVVPATSSPTVTYIQGGPPPAYYYYQPYYYPAYYPAVSLSFGWGNYYRGGYYHGGYYGGWHGGYHGGYGGWHH